MVMELGENSPCTADSWETHVKSQSLSGTEPPWRFARSLIHLKKGHPASTGPHDPYLQKQLLVHLLQGQLPELIVLPVQAVYS